MADKRMSADDVVAQLEDGMTIGIGGWGSRRKPMALVYAIARSSLKDLTIVSYGGPDVGILCKLGKVRKLIFAFVSLDSIPLEPYFRAARQRGEIEVEEYDEGMFWWGLYAAANRLPFLPTRAGLGSSVMDLNPHLKTIQSPYKDGETFVAMPAIPLDVALVHLPRGDERGHGQFLGDDFYLDDIFLGAATKTYMSVEELVATDDLLRPGDDIHSLRVSRMQITGVIEAPKGAGFTECPPYYGRDEEQQRAYAKGAKDPEAWQAFFDEHIAG